MSDELMISDAGFSAEGAEGADSAEGTQAETVAELYELIAGKNPDGTALKKSVSKEEMLKLAQQGFGAGKAFEEATATKSQMKELARMLSDPESAFEVLKKFGHDPDQLMTGRMAKQMIEAMKSPQEVEFEQYKKDAEEYRAMKSKQKADEEENEINTRATQIRDSLYSRIEETLNSAGVPKTKASIAEVGRYIKQMANKAEANGQNFDIESVKLGNIVTYMREQHTQTFTSLFDELDEDGILAMLPESLQKKIGAALTKKLTGRSNVNINAITRKEPSTSIAKEERAKFMSTDEANAQAKARIEKLQEEWKRLK